MSAQEFLRRLEQTGIVSEPLLVDLRKRIAATKRTVRPEQLAKLLVDRGELTKSQARQLIRQIREASGRDHDELGLMPLDDVDPPEVIGHRNDVVPTPADDDLLLLPIEDVDDDVPLVELDLDEDRAQGHVDESSLVPLELDAHDLASVEPEADVAGGDLLADSLFAEDAPSGAAILPPRRRGFRGLWDDLFRSRRPRASQWDSPLLLVGGGVLIVLLFVGVGLLFYLLRGSGDELYELAENDYRDLAYSQAIAKYEKFLAGFPSHPKASEARVRKGLARLRQAVDNAKDWKSALLAAQEVLPNIENEEAFPAARPELASLLPAVSAGLVTEASQSAGDSRQSLVALATDSLALVNDSKYLPTSVRKSVQGTIEGIESELQVVLRQINRDQELKAAVETIHGLSADGKTAEAYDVHSALLRKYPALDDREELHAAVLGIADAERALVSVQESGPAASVEDHVLAAPLRVVLADRRGIPASGAEGHVVFVLVRGAVYGIDGTTGEVLWRRYVGYESPFHPQRLGTGSDSDALVVDRARDELLRLSGRAGQLVWRVRCESPRARPLVLPDRILVTGGREDAGELSVVDPETGNVRQTVSFPMGLAATAAVDLNRGEAYVFGEHSSLYVLALDSLKCRQVVHLGHTAGNVGMGPISVGDYLVAAENAGPDFCQLHVLMQDADRKWKPAVAPLRLDGQVVTPLVSEGRRLLVNTDLGAVHVFDLNNTNPSEPVREVARVHGAATEPRLGFALFNRSSIWLGDRSLTRYELQATRGQLAAKWVLHNDDVFLAPLEHHGGILYHVRQRRGMRGATVTASRIVDTGVGEDGEMIWETDIAVPAAGEVIAGPGPQSVSCITADGALFALDAAVIRSGHANQPTARVDQKRLASALGPHADLDGGHSILLTASPSRQIVLYDAARESLQLVEIDTPSDELVTHIVPFGELLLAASDAGLVHVVDPRTGALAMLPFQPRSEPGEAPQWLTPAVIDGSDAFVIAQRDGGLFRVGINESPRKHLAALGESHVAVNLVAGLAAAGETVYAVIRTADRDAVVAIDSRSEDLALGQQWPLERRVAWGPLTVGDVVLIASDTGELLCLDSDQKLRWSVKHQHGAIVGRPSLVADDFVLAATGGVVWRADQATGETKGESSIGEPLGSGALVLRNRLLIAGSDGTIYVTDTPGGAK